MVKAKSTEKAPVSKAGEKEMSEKANVDAAAAASASEPEKVDAKEPMVVSGGEETKEDNKNNGEAKTEEKVEKNPTKKANKPRKRNRKKKALGDASAGAAKDGDKSEASDRKKAPNKAESMGMVFMCSSKTKKDCYRYKVLGLPAGKKEMVAKIYQGMRLFLFDIDLKLMYGIYKAAGPGGYNIEPQAFKSAFPSQVRFNVLQDCSPLPEEKFKKVIKENYYGKNKFNGQLNSEQVKNLCKLFRHTSNAKSNRGADPPTRAGPRRFGDRDRNRPIPTRPIIYERPVAVAVAPPSYAYERPSDVDYYRRTTELEQRERLLEMELRRRDAVEIRDSYGAYREPPPPTYHVPLYDRPYSVSLAPGYPPLPPPPTSLYR